jgi:hypothetical protein
LSTAPPDAPRDLIDRPLGEWAVLLLGLGVVAACPYYVAADGQVRFEALDRLLRQGTLDASQFSLIGPLFSAPFWLVGRLFGSPRDGVAVYNLLVFVAGLFAVRGLLFRAGLGRVARRLPLLLVYASMFAAHVQHYFGEVFTAVLVAVGLLAVALRGRSWGWGLAALGAANTPAALVGLALTAGVHSLATRRWRCLLAVAAAAALVLLENWLRRGGPLRTGYEGNQGYETVMPYSGRPGFSYPFFFGVLSICLSFGKGLVFFAPGLLLPLGQGRDAWPAGLTAFWRLGLWFLAGLVVVYARWWAWYGGWFWGPRFFLFASVPAALALAVHLADAHRHTLGRNLAALACLVLSGWVALSGMVYGQSNLEVCAENDYALEALLWYTPEFSALWRPFVAPRELNVWEWLRMAGFAVGWGLLAYPLAWRVARQSADAVAAAWRAYRAGETWRF